ncbi:hypothetical protein MBLNU230_g7245t1 [Neophaeotheca triangularis]
MSPPKSTKAEASTGGRANALRRIQFGSFPSAVASDKLAKPTKATNLTEKPDPPPASTDTASFPYLPQIKHAPRRLPNPDTKLIGPPSDPQAEPSQPLNAMETPNSPPTSIPTLSLPTHPKSLTKPQPGLQVNGANLATFNKALNLLSANHYDDPTAKLRVLQKVKKYYQKHSTAHLPGRAKTAKELPGVAYDVCELLRFMGRERIEEVLGLLVEKVGAKEKRKDVKKAEGKENDWPYEIARQGDASKPPGENMQPRARETIRTWLLQTHDNTPASLDPNSPSDSSTLADLYLASQAFPTFAQIWTANPGVHEFRDLTLAAYRRLPKDVYIADAVRTAVQFLDDELHPDERKLEAVEETFDRYNRKVGRVYPGVEVDGDIRDAERVLRRTLKGLPAWVRNRVLDEVDRAFGGGGLVVGEGYLGPHEEEARGEGLGVEAVGCESGDEAKEVSDRGSLGVEADLELRALSEQETVE